MDNKIVTKPYACHDTQGGKAPICYALVPLTAVKTPVSGQEEILQVVKSHSLMVGQNN